MAKNKKISYEDKQRRRSNAITLKHAQCNWHCLHLSS